MKTKYLLLGIGFLVFAFFSWIAFPLPAQNLTPSWTFYDRNGAVLFTENIVVAEQSSIPEDFKAILLATEDKKFYNHFGVDPYALIRAAYQNTTKQEIVSGASTITMQLARLKYLPQTKRNWWYKIRQTFYAFKLEWHLDKETILDQYLKRIAFGNGSQGLTQATQRYFSKQPHQLSIGEQAMLVGLMPNPSRFNPIANPTQAHTRKNKVLDGMKKEGLIDTDNHTFWKNEVIKVNPDINKTIIAPHFIFWVKDRLMRSLNIPAQTKELHIHTSLEKSLYQDLLHIAHQEITQKHTNKNLHNASIIVLENQTGSIVSMVGSINFFDQKRDGAINMAIAPRQSGSTLKPFLYALALERGWSPLSEIIDEPIGYQGEDGSYNPRNFHADRFYGRVRMREALVNSYNLSAVYLLNQIGLDPFDSLLRSLDLELEIAHQKLGLGTILGSGEVSLLKLTNAYRTFPNHGRFTPYQFITKITDEDQSLLFKKDLDKKLQTTILSTSITDWITDALSDRAARWRLFGQGNPLEIDRPAAAKTGTSQAFRDNWVIGYTPQYTVGVWVGNPSRSPLQTTSGIEGAGPIWNKVMRKVHQSLQETEFTYTSNRQSHQVCRRPYQSPPDCHETVRAFLTTKELQDHHPTPRPPLRISFPSDGDRFHPDSKLLLKAIGAPPETIQFYLDGEKVEAFIPTLSPGSHTIYAESNLEQSESITIYRE